MSPKEYLSQIGKLQGMIRGKEKRMEELRAMAGINGSFRFDEDFVQKSKALGSQVERVAIEMAELSGEIEKDRLELIRKKDEITGKIYSLEKPYSELLERRYIEDESWERIAYEMGYTYHYVTVEMHPKALEMIKKLMENETTT